MLEKATAINYCEYITRLSVALSEMADTISSNKNILKDILMSLDTHTILAKLDTMEETVKMFNLRSELPVTSSDVHHLLKYSTDDENDDTDTTFDTMEHVGMMLYVIGSHQKQLRALVRNTAEYSRKCQDLPAKHDFQLNPNLKSLKTWWTTETVTTETRPKAITSAYRRNLLAELGTETDSDEDAHTRKKKKEKGKSKQRVTKQPSISSTSNLSDDDDISPVHTGLITFYSRTFQGLLIIFKESISTCTISHFFYSHSKKAIPVRTNNVVQPKDRIL